MLTNILPYTRGFRYFFLLTILVSFGGCTKTASLEKEGVGQALKNLNWRSASVSEGIWKVGRLYRDTVSKNLTVVLGLPTIKDSDQKVLLSTYGIDSWIVRVVRVNSMNSQNELATILVHFKGSKKGRTSGLNVRAVSFALTYAAAAMSERFRKFQCPAFSHDKRLDDWGINGKQEPIEIPIQAGGTINEKFAENELVPMSLNIGHEMAGEYYFDIALFNSSENRLYSLLKRLPFYLNVGREKNVALDGCAGIHQEYDPPTPDVIPSRRK